VLRAVEDGSPLIVGQRVVGLRTVLAVEGELDIGTVDGLRQAVDGALDAGAHELWIDFSGTTILDSTAIHVLLEAHARLRELDRRLAVICPPGNVRRVLQVAGVDGALPLYDDVVASNHDA
jgi:anti-sigma B factor antagonist